MFERFTDRARRVVVLAQEEARGLNHNYIGSEHILLGLIHEGVGVAAKALESLGIDLEDVRQQVEEIIGRGQETPAGHIPFTPRGKRVLELSLREALQLGHNYIGTEHILLGLLREGEGVGCQVLVRLGVDLDRVRQQVIQILHGYQEQSRPAPTTPLNTVRPVDAAALQSELGLHLERFTDRAQRVVVLAQEEARMLNHNYMGSEHLLLGLRREGEGVAAKALETLGISLDTARQQIAEIIGLGQQVPSGHLPVTPRGRKVLELSLREALQLGHNYIGTEHILLSLVRESEGVGCQVLVRLGADLNRVRQQVIQLLHGYQRTAAAQPAAAEPGAVGRNLTRLARAGELDRVVGRQREIGQVMQILMLEAAVPLLVGERGAGVTAVVHGLAQAAVRRESPRWFAGKDIIELNLNQLTAAATGPEDLDDLVSGLIGQIRDQPGTIWFIERCLNPAYTSASAQTVPAISLLRPVLATGELMAIAVTTPADHRQHLGALRGDFQDIEINEVPEHVAIEVLKSIRDRQQTRHQVSIDDDVIATAVALSIQHLPGTLLPGKAIDLLDRAAAHASSRNITENPLQDMEDNLAGTRQQKENAIDNQDWELAANLRDQEKQVIARLAQKKADLKNQPASGIVAVTRQDLTAALTADPEPAAIGGS